MLKIKDIKDFTLEIKHGAFYWKVILNNDDNLYQIKYRIEPHITPKGNKSKRKIYFIKSNDKELIFDNEVKKSFIAFRRPYIVSGV